MVDIAKDHNGAARSTTGPLLDARPTSSINDGQRHRRDPVAASAPVAGSRSATATRYLLAGIRLALGWIFLWAFLDKTFGLGHSTVAAMKPATATAAIVPNARAACIGTSGRRGGSRRTSRPPPAPIRAPHDAR